MNYTKRKWYYEVDEPRHLKLQSLLQRKVYNQRDVSNVIDRLLDENFNRDNNIRG